MNQPTTKQKIKMIKKKNAKENFNHFIKQETIHFKEQKQQEQNAQTITYNPQVQATNQITSSAKQTFLATKYRTKKFINRKYQEYEFKNITQSTKTNTAIHSNHVTNPNNTATPKNVTFIAKAKQSTVQKLQQSKFKQTTSRIVSAPIIQNTKKAVQSIVGVVKKSVSTVNTLFSFGTGLILLIVMTLFIGTFSVLAQDGGSNSEIISLSEEVIAYEETIRKYAIDYDIEDYISLLQAIMMQESAGLGNDPMQASESPYNTNYPQIPNGIEDPEYSIQVGVQTFSVCLQSANVQDRSDTEHIYLALQGYNYGSDYITWALSNFNGYSKYNAQLYSDNKKTELATNVYGDPLYVDHVMRYVSITFRGGTNPNFNNLEAWVTKNPYAKAGLYGQCTWFAWGRFYELYGYDPGFTGNGWDCVNQLLAAHPDKFERSTTPVSGAVFSGIGKNHVGMVINYDGTTLTIQDGNYDGKTNTFEEAKSDWKTVTYTLDEYRKRMGGVVFANPK